MTREEQILEYADSFKGKGMESEELKEIIRLAIIDGAKWADNHPIKPFPPSNLDEAAWKPSEEHFQGLRRAITKAEKGSDAWNSLTDLYEHLKKL